MATNSNQDVSTLLVDIATLATLANQRAHEKTARRQDVDFQAKLVQQLAELAVKTNDLPLGDHVDTVKSLAANFEALYFQYMAATHAKELVPSAASLQSKAVLFSRPVKEESAAPAALTNGPKFTRGAPAA